MSIHTAVIGPAMLPDAARVLARACRFDRAAAVAEEKLFGASAGGVATAVGAAGEHCVRTADEPGNYLTPGIDVRRPGAAAVTAEPRALSPRARRRRRCDGAVSPRPIR